MEDLVKSIQKDLKLEAKKAQKMKGGKVKKMETETISEIVAKINKDQQPDEFGSSGGAVKPKRKYKKKPKGGAVVKPKKSVRCPHCEKLIDLNTGGAKIKREMTKKQSKWMDHVKWVSGLPQAKGLARPEIMKLASALKDQGIKAGAIKGEPLSKAEEFMLSKI